MNKETVRREIEMKLERKVASDLKLHNVYLLVHSDKLDIHWPMAAGETDGFPANPKQPYHTASVGKTFTSVLLAILVEKGLVKFDDPIANYLPPDILKDLHLFKGKEYTYDIQIKHLLSNKSGIPDYFEDKPRQGKALMEEILENPSRFWTPQETIHWSKEHLQPRFPPGKRVHYTDTGYNLLGLIIETITSKPFHEVLHDYIFTPLHMNHSYLSQYSNPAIKSEHPVAKLYMDELKINVDDYRSFSSFYAGGQTVCTSEDLLIFMKALVNNQIIQKETLDIMHQWNKMWIGMDYGYGLMRIHFLPFTRKYIGWGHLGASGASMLYFPNMDVYIMGSFNQTAYQSKSMNYIFFNVLRKLAKYAHS
ncbi:serine hydrolase domain-containing protein [Paenibacillus sp. OSY-SE]|uniref:serine hydrolase domain-containing protein n=1 Tax=Paenibacillus sp. OSY-SE TaxID=1196323 RepID=UPI0003120546|nr:serine hydrolase domain-containing protein [Paenibacillus sp. OSY-SE]